MGWGDWKPASEAPDMWVLNAGMAKPSVVESLSVQR
jgi:hypothetical protein